MSRARSAAIVQKQVELRKKLWPLIEDNDLWLRKSRTGFATIPRAMPAISVIMDGMNNGARVSSSYLGLWCLVMDEMFVTIQSQNSMAFYAGFEGERAVRTWRDRMKRLKDQGFIDYQAGPNGDITYVILLNPYHVIRRHKAMKHPGITETRYNTLIARAHDIGAEDMNEALPDDPLKRKPKPVQVFDLDDEMPF